MATTAHTPAKKHRRPMYAKEPTENTGSLFETYCEPEYNYFGPRDPPKRKTEPAKPPKTPENAPSEKSYRGKEEPVEHWNDRGSSRGSANGSRDGARYSALRLDLERTNNRTYALDERVDTLDKGWKDVSPRVGDAETTMTGRGTRVDELDVRNRMHAAKIQDLSNELEHVRLENERIKGQLLASGEPISLRHDPVYKYESDLNQDNSAARYGDDEEFRQYVPPQDQAPPAPSRHSDRSDSTVVPTTKYLGFHKYYDPQQITATRREGVPYLTNKHEKELEQEWRIKKNQEEAKLMKDKPRTYEYTAPFDSYNPPRDVNRFFHDSKYDEKRPPLTPASDYADETVPFHRNPGTSLTTYARQYIGPRRDATQQPTGGLYVLRYDGSGCMSVNVALKRLQTIIKSYEGHVLGIAANDNVFVMSGDGDWVSSRQQQKKRNINLTYRSVDQSVAIIWFPNKHKALDFFSNTFRNPFKENGFPTQHGYECVYIPMVTPPMLKSFDAYVFMELQDPQKCNPEELVQFEAELRQEMLNCVNNCLPFVVSCHKGRENFKPGSLFKTNSKVFVSRFNYMQDVAHIWNSGIIQRCAQKYGIDMSRMNIFAVSLKDWLD